MGEGRRGGEQAQEGDAARIKKQDPKPEAWSSPDFQRNRDYIFVSWLLIDSLLHHDPRGGDKTFGREEIHDTMCKYIHPHFF